MDFSTIPEIKSLYQFLALILSVLLGYFVRDLRYKRKHSIDIAMKNLEISNATYHKATELNDKIMLNLTRKIDEMEGKIIALEKRVHELEDINATLTIENKELKKNLQQ